MFRKALFSLSLLLVPLFLAQPVQAHPHLLDIRTGTEISYHDMLKDLASVQVVFIGESHDHSGHHRMQLTLIRDLEKQNPQLAVGLEMFQIDFQQDLDRWTRGRNWPKVNSCRFSNRTGAGGPAIAPFSSMPGQAASGCWP